MFQQSTIGSSRGTGSRFQTLQNQHRRGQPRDVNP
jgi:hypothetical protein